jgi:hypothetical protein
LPVKTRSVKASTIQIFIRGGRSPAARDMAACVYQRQRCRRLRVSAVRL